MPTLRAPDDRIVPAAGGGTPGITAEGAPTPDLLARHLLARDLLARGRSRWGGTGQGAGIGLGLVSAMLFGTSGTFGSALIGAGWSPAARATSAAISAYCC